MQSDNIAVVNGITKRFGTVTAVNDVSLSLKEGEILALLGPSGCGKTTILRSIAGLEEIDEGEIFIAGNIASSASKRFFVSPEKRNIGFIFQNFALWPTKTVHDNVGYGLKARKFSREEIDKRVKRYLELVRLENLEARYPSQLSGGEQQRVALARALAYEPRILLMDEPLSNLDLKERERMRAELRKLLKSLGTTAILVTHDQDEAFTIADRTMVMNKGKVIQEGKPRELYEKPNELFVVDFIGKANIFRASLTSNGEVDGALLRIDGLDEPLPIGEGEPGQYYAIIRPNEIGLSESKPERKGTILLGKIISKDYRGAITDWRISVGAVEITVATHKFCSISDAEAEDRVYLLVPDKAVKLIRIP